jgi:hypothetical protein
MMIAHIDDEADFMTVLSRLSSRYSGLVGIPAAVLRGPVIIFETRSTHIESRSGTGSTYG